MSFIPKFGYPDLCGQALIDWALKNKETAFSVFEPQLPPLHHKYKVAGLQPYQIQSVITALQARFPGDFTLTRQHPAQPDARPQPQSGEDERLAARVLSPASVFSQAGEVAPPDSLTHETFQLFS